MAKTGAAATGLSRDRQVGSVYTPPAIARQMVCACLDRWEELNSTEVAGAAAYLIKLAIGGFLLALFETAVAKMRVFRASDFLGAALMLGLLGTLLLFVSRSL